MRSFSILCLFYTLNFGLLNGQVSDTLDLEQVIISSSRAQSIDPVTIQNISNAQIEEVYYGQDPSALLEQLSPSILTYSDAGSDIGNYVQFRMRGMSQSRINTSLNGVPLNDMLDQGVFFSNFSDFTNSVESIQVQRGVGVSNSGIASYGGAVNFASKNIFKEESEIGLQLTAGSFGTVRTSAEMTSGLSKNGFGAYGRLTRIQSNGYKVNSGSDSYSMFGSVGKSGNKYVLKFTGFMGKTQNDQSYLPVLLTDIQADPKTNYNHPNDTDDFEQELFMLQYSRSVSEQTTFNSTIYYGSARGEFPFGIDNETQFVFGLTNNRFGLQSNITTEKGPLAINFGWQGYVFKRKNYEHLAPNRSTPYSKDQSDKFELSTFANMNYDISKFHLYLKAQLRYVDIDLERDFELGTGLDFSQNWFFLNWQGGASLKLNEENNVYLSLGRTGREPTRSDILFGASENESVIDLELGWRLQKNNFRLNANLFHMNFTNEISQVGALQDRSYMEIRQSVPKSRRSGMEIEMEHRPNRNLKWTLNTAYLNTNVSEFPDGNNPVQDVNHIFSPRWIVNPGLNIIASDKSDIAFFARFASSSFMELANSDSFEIPSHSIVGSRINVKIGESTGVSLTINNIFNQRYFTDGAPVDLDFDGNVEGPGYRIQAPRNFYITLSTKL